MRRGWTVDKARKWAITLGGLIMLPGLLLTSIAAHPIVAVLLIAVVLFGFQVSIGNIQTLPSDFYAGAVMNLWAAGRIALRQVDRKKNCVFAFCVFLRRCVIIEPGYRFVRDRCIAPHFFSSFAGVLSNAPMPSGMA